MESLSLRTSTGFEVITSSLDVHHHYWSYSDDSEVTTSKPVKVLIKILLAPVNPADINTIQGVYPVKPPLPAVPGNEFIGVVEQVGADVKNICPGDHVVPNGEALGSWRTHAIIDESKVYKVIQPVKEDGDFVSLAGITSNPSTAYRMLKDFVDLKPGDTVVQNGANSAAGQNVIQLCKIWGINTINIIRYRSGYEELREYLIDLGATEVVRADDLRSFVPTNIPKPKLALNCVGGKIALETMYMLDHHGAMVTYGGMSREPVSVPTAALIFKNYKFFGYWMTRWYRENRGSEKHQQMFNDLMSYIKSEQLKPPRYQIVPLKDYKVALLNTLNREGFIGVKYFLDMRE